MRLTYSKFILTLGVVLTTFIHSNAQTETHKNSVMELVTEYNNYLNSASKQTPFLSSKEVFVAKPVRDNTNEPYFTVSELKEQYISSYGPDAQVVFNEKRIKISNILIDKKLNTYYATAIIPQQIRYLEINSSYKDTTYIDSLLTLTKIGRLDSTVSVDSIYSIDSSYTMTERTDSILISDTLKKTNNIILNLYITMKYKVASEKYTEYKIEAITFNKRPYKHQPISELSQYWVSLGEDWQKLIKEKLRFPEVATDYYLERISGISSLDLTKSEITNFEPLQKFNGLKTLNLSGRPLDTLHYIQNCVKLKDLNISNCSLTSLHGLENMTLLESLKAANNEIEDLTPIKNCSQIIVLNLNENKIKDLSPLSSMRTMQRLYLDLNLIEDLAPLKNMIILSELYIKKNRDIKSLEPIASHRTLVKLDCYNTKIESLEPIKNHTRMVHLDCGYTQIKSLAPIRNLTELRHLAFVGNYISDFNALNRLDQVRHLNCSSTNISDISVISRMDKLKELNAISTEFSKSDIQRFKRKNPKVAINYY